MDSPLPPTLPFQSPADRRQYPRFVLVAGYAALILRKMDDDRMVEGTAYDISRGGMRFEADEIQVVYEEETQTLFEHPRYNLESGGETFVAATAAAATFAGTDTLEVSDDLLDEVLADPELRGQLENMLQDAAIHEPDRAVLYAVG